MRLYNGRGVVPHVPSRMYFGNPDDAVVAKISATAQAILDARALYPDSSLADLYDDVAMPPELRKAHRANDAAVLEAYGLPKDATESDIVARLFKMYQELCLY